MLADTSTSITWETLTAVGIRVPAYRRVASAHEAVLFFHDSPAPAVVVKADTDLHKASLGLVAVGLANDEDVQHAWTSIHEKARALGVDGPLLIQEMVEPGPELFAGIVHDAAFGPVIVAGLGGRLIESIRRRTIRLLPIATADARAMVTELGLDRLGLMRSAEEFVSLLTALSRLSDAFPTISELDLNPVILGEHGAHAVDLRTVMEESRLTAEPLSQTSDEGAVAAIGKLISPRGVAVVGASADHSKPGGRAYRLLAEFAPEIKRYAVNPRGGMIGGQPSIRQIADLPDGVDTAVLATPGEMLPELLSQLGARGIPTAVAFASGFRESGNVEGEALVLEAARAASVRLCGVNGMGLIGDVPLTFTQAMSDSHLPGDVSFLTQSGAIGGSLLIGAWAQSLGTARFISVGNETDLTISDYLDFLTQDDATRTIGVFLEGVRDGQRFRRALQSARSAGKRVVVLRAGTSIVGAAAARSHTGALAGEDDVYRQVFADAGVVLVSDIPELLGACQALSWQPCARGNNVAVLSTSGGGCSLVADHLARVGLEVPALDAQTRQVLADVLPPYASMRNPIDTTGNIATDARLLGRIIEPVMGSAAIDSAVIAISALVDDAAERIVDGVVDATRKTDKPIVVAWMLPEVAVSSSCERLRRERIPVFTSVQHACVALSALSPSLGIPESGGGPAAVAYG